MNSDFLIIAAFVLVSYITIGLSGFGGVIITLTLGSYFYPVEVLLPVLVPLTLTANAYIAIRHQKYVDRKVLLKIILPGMGLGFVVGLGLFNMLEGEILIKLLGALVIILSVRELILLFHIMGGGKPTSGLKSLLYIFLAGVVHGVYASGGPILVYALSRLNLPKSVFRSTLSMVWISFNIILITSYVITQKLTPSSLKFTAMLLPVGFLGMMIGEKFHSIVNERVFKIIVFMILLFAGVAISFK